MNYCRSSYMSSVSQCGFCKCGLNGMLSCLIIGFNSWGAVHGFVCSRSFVARLVSVHVAFCGEILLVYLFREMFYLWRWYGKNTASYSFSDDIPSFLLVPSFALCG